MPKEHEVVLRTKHPVPGDGTFLLHEFDGFGNHRLAHVSSSNEMLLQGDWASWHGFARLKHEPIAPTIMGTTEHYSGVLPRVFLTIEGLSFNGPVADEHRGAFDLFITLSERPNEVTRMSDTLRAWWD